MKVIHMTIVNVFGSIKNTRLGKEKQQERKSEKQ